MVLNRALLQIGSVGVPKKLNFLVQWCISLAGRMDEREVQLEGDAEAPAADSGAPRSAASLGTFKAFSRPRSELRKRDAVRYP